MKTNVYLKVINHGIPTAVMKDALDSAEEFFNLLSDEKTCFASTDVHEPREDGKLCEGSEGVTKAVLNCYPSCPKPDLALGMPPHTDFGMITILNQTHQGLEIMDHDKKWHPVPFIQGALIVQLGDQLEVISNGRYKSVPHRAILNVQRKWFSIASLHSMHIEKKVGPAPELVDEQHPVAYREGSFGGFLDYISVNSLSKGKYIDTLRIT
ncbi:hypothetical protein L1987_28966 [Smallanthus sonchifolius]|uniref:Uncharacterized protein n=1 Tax=Smallanthus sonchifolius TaxID=185202 RepID=A0ACB9HZ88_9ASTR|nr:hypothetical protein L1987_28966 [Smallanthus sonchifolius]